MYRRNQVRLKASQSELSVNNTVESHKIDLLSFQIDKSHGGQNGQKISTKNFLKFLFPNPSMSRKYYKTQIN